MKYVINLFIFITLKMEEVNGTVVHEAHLVAVEAPSEVETLELGGSGSLERRSFDPVAHELDATFRLTKYADLKGNGCKIPQEDIAKLLKGIQDNPQDHVQLEGGVGELVVVKSFLLGVEICK